MRVAPHPGRHPVVGLDGRPERLGGAVEPGLRRPERDAHRLRRIRERQVQVVDEDHDGALVGRNLSEAALQLIVHGELRSPAGVAGSSAGVRRISTADTRLLRRMALKQARTRSRRIQASNFSGSRSRGSDRQASMNVS